MTFVKITVSVVEMRAYSEIKNLREWDRQYVQEGSRQVICELSDQCHETKRVLKRWESAEH